MAWCFARSRTTTRSAFSGWSAPWPAGEEASFSAADYRDLKKDATNLSSIAGYRSDIVDLTGRGEPVRIIGMQTTAGFFDVFDAPPLRGRTYHEATDKPGAAVAVISEAIWRQHFGGADSAIGTQVRLNGTPTEIIGVVPDWFRHPTKSDAWMLSPLDVPTSPFSLDASGSREVQYFSAVARVDRGKTIVEAREQLKAIGSRLADEFAKTNAGEALDGKPLADSMVADVRTALFVLMGAVGIRAADRVRERRGPAGGEGRLAAPRAGGAHRAWRRTRPADAAVADRKPRARRRWWRARLAGRELGARSARRAWRPTTCRGWPTSRSTGVSRSSPSPPPLSSACCSASPPRCRRRGPSSTPISKTAAAPARRAPARATSWWSRRSPSRSCC